MFRSCLKNILSLPPSLSLSLGKSGKIFSRQRGYHAFTLIELMIVIAIIGILGAVLYPSGAYYLRQARDTQRENNIIKLAQSHTSYYIDRSEYPEHTTDGCVSPVLEGKYISPMPSSPSGNRYNEGCGNNGKYAFSVSVDKNAYMIFATMEGAKRGNYTGDQNNTIPVGNILNDKNIFQNIINSLQAKSGKFFVMAEGDIKNQSGSTNASGNTNNTPLIPPPPLPPSPPSPPSPPPPPPPLIPPTATPCSARNGQGTQQPGSTLCRLTRCNSGFTLNTATNACIPINTPPRITEIRGNKTLLEGETLDLTIMATDSENNTLTYSAEGLIPGISLQGNKITGTSAQAKRISLTIKANDGKADSTPFNVDIIFQADTRCQNPIYRHSNSITIKAKPCTEGGREYDFEGEKYYVARDKGDLDSKIRSGYTANNIVTSKVTNMSGLFRNSQFNQPINHWDTSNVTNMSYMFAATSKFNQPIDNWDTSNVTNMYGMFNHTYKFNQALNNWNVSNVTNMGGTFYEAFEFNQPIDNWNTSNVTNMYGMFYAASKFNQSLNNWNTSKVTTMQSMFAKASNFNQPLNNWNTSKVTNMSNMFQNANSFNQPLNNWNISNVADMYGMFYGATSFHQNISNWNTTSISNCRDFANNTFPPHFRPVKCH